jgi:hypothetical protein
MSHFKHTNTGDKKTNSDRLNNLKRTQFQALFRLAGYHHTSTPGGFTLPLPAAAVAILSIASHRGLQLSYPTHPRLQVWVSRKKGDERPLEGHPLRQPSSQ